jgi:hypothetical protein
LKINLKNERKIIFGESDDKGGFDVLEFIFRKQIQFKTYIYIPLERNN